MTEKEMQFILYALSSIEAGYAEKLENGRLTVYRCGKVIRIDVKEA